MRSLLMGAPMPTWSICAERTTNSFLRAGSEPVSLATTLEDSRALARMTALALSEVRQRLAIFAQGGDFREGVAGTGEELFSGGGVEGHA